MELNNNEIETTLAKQRDYLDRVKVFDSPDIYQWLSTKGREYKISYEYQSIIRKKERTDDNIFHSRMAGILIS